MLQLLATRQDFRDFEKIRKRVICYDNKVSLGEAIGTVPFWITFIMFICFGTCLFGIQVHIVPHAIELGNDPISAANLLSVNLGVSILGNYLFGSLGDRIGNRCQ